MQLKTLLIIAAAALLLVGCAQKTEETQPVETVTEPIAATLPPTEPTEPDPITLGGRVIAEDAADLILTDADPEELTEKLPLLPRIEKILLVGQMPEPEILRQLMEEFPGITFSGSAEINGRLVSLDAQALNLVGLEDTTALERWLPCFRNLTRIDLGDSKIPNEELDRLNRAFPKTKIVWNVTIGPLRISTDVTWFMPNALGIVNIPTRDLYNLRYCTDVTMIDLGHFEVTNVDFVESMPNLEILMLCDARIRDLTPISNCQRLKFLELFLSSVNDYWPLLNLTSLEDLNLCFDPCYSRTSFGGAGDITPLYQMPWLHRLWMPLNALEIKDRQTLRDALPTTEIFFPTPRDSSTGKGWRMQPYYYAQRDMVGRPYMTK